MHTLDSTVTRLALSLWSSARRVEKLPVVRVWSQREIVSLVANPFELENTMIVNRYEGI